MSAKRPRLIRLSLIAAAAMVLSGGGVAAVAGTPASTPAAGTTTAYSTTLEQLGPQKQVTAALYQPTQDTANASTVLVLMHETSNLIGSAPCLQMAQRGYSVLCGDIKQFVDLPQVDLDQVATDIGYAVTYARSLPAQKHVVLIGWSGGGEDDAYYQNVAQNGVKACQAAERLDPCSDSLAGLPPADGVILLDSVPGLAFQFASLLDPSSSTPHGLTSASRAALDVFSPANGYNPVETAPSHYSTAFLNKVTAAQSAREAKLVAQAQALKTKITKGRDEFTDDAPFPVGRDAARPWQQDPTLLSHTVGRYPLISPAHPSGAVQVVKSVRPVPDNAAVPSSPEANESWSTGGGSYTVNTFLSTFAIKAGNYRVTPDSITGVDWASSNTSTTTNMSGVTTPTLVMSMTGHYWVVPSEMYYKATKAKDKTLAFVDGATHNFTPCTECSPDSAQYGDTTAETFDYMSRWLQARY